MVVVDQDRVGSLEGFVAQEPLAHVLQHVDRDAGRTLAHGRDAQVRAVAISAASKVG